MYEAIVLRAQTRPHPKADRLIIVQVGEHQVISTSVKDGDLCVFFPIDGCLDPEFLSENSEFREGCGINRDPKKSGFFEEKGRVKLVRLRGEPSQGYIAPLESFSYCGPVEWKEGMTFTELNGHKICSKYMTPATRERIARQNQVKTPKVKALNFPEHFDTKRLLDHLKALPIGAVCYITEKFHGTSGRTGFIPVNTPLSWWDKFKLQLVLLLGGRPSQPYRIMSGSRRVNFPPGSIYNDAYRHVAECELVDQIKPDEIIYYEIVGWDRQDPLFHHSLDPKTKDPFEKEILSQFGASIDYTYGLPRGQTQVLVYRITVGGRALSWADTQTRCQELGVKAVTQLAPAFVIVDETSRGELLKLCKKLSNGVSTLGTNPREGICLRVEAPNITPSMSILKLKGDIFETLEGRRKNDDDYVDKEEIA